MLNRRSKIAYRNVSQYLNMELKGINERLNALQTAFEALMERTEITPSSEVMFAANSIRKYFESISDYMTTSEIIEVFLCVRFCMLKQRFIYTQSVPIAEGSALLDHIMVEL